MFTATFKASIGVGWQYEWLHPLLHHKLFKLTDVRLFRGFLYPLVSEDDSQHVIVIYRLRGFSRVGKSVEVLLI